MGKEERRLISRVIPPPVTERPPQQGTKMVIKVELDVEKSREKIEEVLSDIPRTIEIQNTEYNEKDNVVLITVVCPSPEKVKKKPPRGLLPIMMPEEAPPPKPKEPEKRKEAPPPEPIEPEKPKEAPPPKPKEPEKPKEAPPPKPKEPEKPKEAPMAPAPVPPQPPVPTCCREFYEGYGGGPCWGGYGGRGPCWGGYEGPSGPCYGRPIYDSWEGGYWRPIYPSRCTDYICEENPNAACSIM